MEKYMKINPAHNKQLYIINIQKTHNKNFKNNKKVKKLNISWKKLILNFFWRSLNLRLKVEALLTPTQNKRGESTKLKMC